MKLTRMLMVFSLVALLAIPATSMAEIGNSGKITKELPADLENLTINAKNVDVELKLAKDGVAPYAELDATVIGIHSADVTYTLEVTEDENGTVIDVSHNGTDIGIDDVDVHIYVPGALKNLAVNLNGSDMEIDRVYTQIISGEVIGGELEAKHGEVYDLNLTLNNAELDFEGVIGGVTLTADRSEIDLSSTTVPEGLVITGSDTDIDLRLPKNFSLTYDITGGRFHTNLMEGYHESNGTMHFGEGGPTFTVTLNVGRLDVKEAK